jgi:uncharacterized protein (DUF1501 family)
MKRRDFIKNTTLSSLAIPFVLKDLKYQAIAQQLFTPSRSAEDKVLVLIKLGGGNDGLNTLIPLDGYDNLVNQRSNIILPENSLLGITETLAFHPSMTGMRDLYQNGKLSIVQNVGYPEQNRSHFRSTDIWSTGMMDQGATTGWLGRHLDANFPNFPEDYPNDNNPDPFAISMGNQVSATCQGLMANFSHTVQDPFDTFSLTENGTVNDGTYFGDHMEYLGTIIAQTNAYGSQITAGVNAGSTLSTMYDDNNPIAVQLRYIAQMISGGLETKIYILNLDGFDTHDAQVTSTDPLLGKHTELLTQLSSAIAAFQDDLALLNLEHRVAGMTFSEFGRQIASNASFGTDHGDAAPLFLFGSCVNDSIIGANPVIADQVTDQAGIPMEIDFRNVYASVLKYWFEVDDTEIQSIFEHQVSYYNIMNGCSSGIEDKKTNVNQAIVYPNPAANNITVQFNATNKWTRVEILDLQGKEVQLIYEGKLAEGPHKIPCHIADLAQGHYVVQIKNGESLTSLKLVKVQKL